MPQVSYGESNSNMELISFIALILLSLVGYCAGAVSKAGKYVELKPQIIDLMLVTVIWPGCSLFQDGSRLKQVACDSNVGNLEYHNRNISCLA